MIGFTNGIAVLIAVSQIKDWLGLAIPKMPADFFTQVGVMAQHIGTFNPYSFGLGAACLLGLFVWPRLWHARLADRLPAGVPGLKEASEVGARIPGPIVALATLTFIAWYFRLTVETIGSRFGAIPRGQPPHP